MGDFELSVDAEPGVADSGDLETDLPDLLVTLGRAARAADRPVAILVDELQYLTDQEFSALILAMHQINQHGLPVVLVGAGLPQILGLAGNSKSYSERLFSYPEIGALSYEDARSAIVNPAFEEGVEYEQAAVEEILAATQCYPYVLQQWGYEAWNIATGERITLEDAQQASAQAIRVLDESFFKVRFDRCTPSERRYMRALADLGPGPHRSGDIADRLGVKVTSAGPARSTLIRKGMIYSPAHGDTAFTVPLFDEYMRRVMPVLERKEPSL